MKIVITLEVTEEILKGTTPEDIEATLVNYAEKSGYCVESEIIL